ncbi:ABC transporter substrate-binding protein [Mycolicibacterium poriferae]|uniref:Fe3+-citrate ABC transporter substrate-binding protein n=1 Tax=Mycolicibacterium poriferae TaxID=39694 RepID=A0A6N4VCK8_9MYCO|nr:iron-siderophore ABC transporter substrate-binding protein [Mycolicibacterium poriferae]MCV7261772.1 iron-siderophore ABC transporter substrate-binding protein [Mycolicibacterium poriferae]BBX51387.1 Fe3+-citrate ABC transporter substrate-binding protein [Mycolicibacterium poriferae]
MLFTGTRRGGRASRTAVLAVLLSVVGVAALSGCGSGSDAPPDSSIITSTTRIAGAGVLGNDRRPDESCAPEPAPLEDGPPQREVRNATGHAVSPPIPETTMVPADPQRIVVLSGSQLDALCALGLQSRIVAAALPDGSGVQPAYLGSVIHDLPGAGNRSEPDLSAIRDTDPDLILGSAALTPRIHPELSEIAPTVFSGPAGTEWRETLRTVGAATGRPAAADTLVEQFDRAAATTGEQNDATHFQASVVQFTDSTLRIFGVDNFPGSVLAAASVDRPATQRFTEKPFDEIGISDADMGNDPDFSAADGDLVYVSFASDEAKQRGSEIMRSDAWKRLSAVRDDRVFAVNNAVWQSGQGLIAARGVLADLNLVDAPIN